MKTTASLFYRCLEQDADADADADAIVAVSSMLSQSSERLFKTSQRQPSQSRLPRMDWINNLASLRHKQGVLMHIQYLCFYRTRIKKNSILFSFL